MDVPIGSCGMRGGKIGLMLMLMLVALGIAGGVFFVDDQHLVLLYDTLFCVCFFLFF